MAAVVVRSNWCKLLLALVLLASFASSTGLVDVSPITRVTFLDLSGKDGLITAKLTYSSIEMEIEHDQTALAEAMHEAQKGDLKKAEEILEFEGLEEHMNLLSVEAEPLGGRSIEFFYIKEEHENGNLISTRVAIDGCNPANATNSEGVTTCDLPLDVYEGKCTEVFASFGDPIYGAQENEITYKYVENSIQVCDKNANSLSHMSDSLKIILLNADFAPICLISMIMGGLLLASMFFAGRSPLALLDITTPLLPKAKSIAYRDLKMGTGFTRMGKGMAALATNLASSSKETSEQLIRRIRANRKYSKSLLTKIRDSNASETIKMMALRAVLAGKDKRYLEKLLDLDRAFKKDGLSKEYQEGYGKFLRDLDGFEDSRDLDKDYKLHTRISDLAKMNMYIQINQASFGGSTGAVPPWLRGRLGKTLGRLPFIGTHIMGATASFFFGGRHLGRMYNSLARGTVRVVGDAVTSDSEIKFTKRIQMSVDSARRKGRKPGALANWAALSAAEQEMARIFNNYEYGSELYKRMMSGAKKDVLNWLVGTIIDKCGGKTNLGTEEVLEIGLKNPTDLMFQKMDLKKFKKIENELRGIFSNSQLTDMQKARRIMGLMDAYVDDKDMHMQYDRAGVSRAIGVLTGLELGTPVNFDGSLKYGNEQAVLDCYKLERLQSYLREQFKIDQDVNFKTEYLDRGKFFFSVGRPKLTHTMVGRDGVHKVTSDLRFGTLFREMYRKSLETPSSRGGKPLSIGNVANLAFVRVLSENWGLHDPNTPGISADLKLMMSNAQRWLQSLANISAFGVKDSSEIPMDKLLASLYSQSARGEEEADLMGIADHGAEYGAKRGAWRTDMHVHWKMRGGPMGGAKASVQEQAHGEVNRAHTVPFAIQQMRNANPHLTPKQAEERYLNKVLVPDYLFKRLKGMMEQDNPNTYFTFGGEFHRFKEQWAAYRARIFEHPELLSHEMQKQFEKDRKSGKIKTVDDINDKYLESFIQRPISLQDVSNSSWIRLKEGSFVPFVQGHTFNVAQADRVVNAKMYLRRGGYWEEFSPDKFSKEAPLKELLGKESKIKKWLFGETDYILREGEIQGISRPILKKYVAIMDDFKRVNTKRAKGEQATLAVTQSQITSFLKDLDGLAISKPKKAEACAAMVARMQSDGKNNLRDELGINLLDLSRYGAKFANRINMEFLIKDYQSAETDAQRLNAAKALKTWAREGAPGEERQVKVALLFNRYGESKGNWTDINNYNEAIKIAPGSIHIPGQPDQVQRYEQLTGLRGWLKREFDTVHNAMDPYLKKANVGLEQFMLSTFGKQMRTEYEGSLNSEYFREAGAKFAARLAAGEYGNVNARNNPAMREYNRLMDSFTRWHAVWDETITRDPRGNSSAIGSASIYSGFFHHGPAMAFGPGPYRRWSYAGYKQPWSSPSGFVANVRERLAGVAAAPQMFNWAVGTPFGVAYRTYITSRWGFMTKYDRKYGNVEQVAQAQDSYQRLMDNYNVQIGKRKDELVLNGYSKADAFASASKQFKDQKPQMPVFELDRNTLSPYTETASRTGEAHASLLNWFYSAFDPTSVNASRIGAQLAAAPISPIALIPSRWIQSKILGGGSPILNREDKNPHYIPPQGLRAQLVKHAGPMVKRQYGGTEMVTGVVRAHEDTWAYQAGVNAIWGNANPGASYIDFSSSLHLDPRAANYLRYESRFRPFYNYDDYIKRQANLGLVKRDVDPYSLMMQRNAEIKRYKFPQNTLFRFFSPVTYAGYKGAAYMGKIGRTVSSARNFFQENQTNTSTTRGGRIVIGAEYTASRAAEGLSNFFERKSLAFSKAIRHCGACGSPMPEGGVCHACSQKTRCPHCNKLVNPSHNHECNYGLSRNLLKDDIGGVTRRDRWGRRV